MSDLVCSNVEELTLKEACGRWYPKKTRVSPAGSHSSGSCGFFSVYSSCTLILVCIP